METGSCGWVRRFLGPWKDGELDPADAARIEGHIASCPECAAQARFEKWFAGEVRRLADRPRAPERLAQRVSFELRREQRARRIRRAVWAAGSVAAAAGLVLLVAFVVRQPSSDSGSTAGRPVVAQPSGAGEAPPSASPAPPGFLLAARQDGDPFVADLVDRHERVVQHTLPLELSTADGNAAAAWFEDKVSFALRVPRFSDPRVRLRGGRLTRVGDQDAAYLGYELQGRPLSVLVLPGGSRPVGGERSYDVGGRTVFASRRNDLNYAVFRDGDVVYAIVSDLPEMTLVELAGQIR